MSRFTLAVSGSVPSQTVSMVYHVFPILRSTVLQKGLLLLQIGLALLQKGLRRVKDRIKVALMVKDLAKLKDQIVFPLHRGTVDVVNADNLSHI